MEGVIEIDGRVAYFYLVIGGKPEADVWLFNRDFYPETPEWKVSAPKPFRNSLGYSRAMVIEFPNIPKKGLNWDVVWDGFECTVTVNGITWAKLGPGERPGRCILATKDGPLARLANWKSQ